MNWVVVRWIFFRSERLLGEAMGFDKKYPKRKDHRKGYFDSRWFDASCRSGGSCPYCARGRLHSSNRSVPADMKEQLQDYGPGTRNTTDNGSASKD